MSEKLCFKFSVLKRLIRIGAKSRKLLKSIKTPEDYLKLLTDNWDSYKPSQLTVTDKHAGDLPVMSELFSQFNEYRVIRERYNFPYRPECDDLTNAVRIMQWLTDHTFYCGCTRNFLPDNTAEILNSSVDKGFLCSLNCRYKALALTDILIAFGIKALPVCMISNNGGCHFTVHIFIRELNKFIICDPSFNCYFTNSEGMPLSVFELRDALIENTAVSLVGYSLFGKDQLKDLYKSMFINDCLANISTWKTNKRTKKMNSTLLGIDFKSAVPKNLLG